MSILRIDGFILDTDDHMGSSLQSFRQPESKKTAKIAHYLIKDNDNGENWHYYGKRQRLGCDEPCR
ncbi:MAG: hypothetical protein IKZ88_09335 [Neisseriaceae bacterium]|nr:hypothetical protein [Neisseriaceae bacterium]